MTNSELILELTTSEKRRIAWFNFCKHNSPAVAASLDMARAQGLDETEALRVAVCCLCETITQYKTDAWNQREEAI